MSILLRFCCGGRKPGESRYCVSGSAAGAFRFVGDGVRPSSAFTRATLSSSFSWAYGVGKELLVEARLAGAGQADGDDDEAFRIHNCLTSFWVA